METCYNHPERKAYSICHSCGRHFCEECLTAETEFYYCKSPECREIIKTELKKDSYQEEITCPNCQSTLRVSLVEMLSAGFRCPECDSFIIVLNGRPELPGDKNFVQLLSSVNQGDTAIIKSMLDNAEIDFYVTGENSVYEPVVIYVNDEQINLAKEILKDFEFHLLDFTNNREEEEF